MSNWKMSIVVAALLALWAMPAHGQGKFSGRVVVEWVVGQSPERDMRLMEPFTFIDLAGKTWAVPAGITINGASIPRAFWTMVGSPYTGNYRRASVVHDHYCVTKSAGWREVHRMFFHAMVAGGVPELDAKVLYAAVYAGGPRWRNIVTKNFEGALETLVVPQLATVPQHVQEQTTQWIRQTNPSLESIEQQLDVDVTVR